MKILLGDFNAKVFSNQLLGMRVHMELVTIRESR
jgi:hypothetical protein